MEASLYEPIYLSIIAVLSLATGLRLMLTPGNTLAVGVHQRGNTAYAALLCLALSVWLGLRPVAAEFGDTVNYAVFYHVLTDRPELSLSAEWGWDCFTYLCQICGLPVSTYFLIIELAYIMVSFIAIRKFVPTSPWLGTLYFISALFFFSFGTNGLRNGVACSIALLVIACMLEERFLKAAILSIIAISIHRSAALPLGAAVMAITFLKNPLHALWIWLVCIVLSLLFGSYWMELIADSGFDDRLTQYTDVDQETIDSYGTIMKFRWDFLAYSAIPVIYIFYLYASGLRDGWFNTLSIIYLLANSFWVLMIRAAFSNRFAYLSWFLIPVIIVYPLCNMNVWRRQNFYAGFMLMTYTAITVIILSLIW